MGKDMREDILAPLIGEEDIRVGVGALARRLDDLYGDAPLVMICVLKGAFVFFSDLVRCMRCRPVLDFVGISSYAQADSSFTPQLTHDVSLPLRDRHVLIVEDIVDTGWSMDMLLERLGRESLLSLRLAALIDKPERRERPVRVDFSLFHVERGFVVGYGLDYAERHRTLPALYTLENPD
jgi:hypoxanthine phosphoribosyltransferase